MGSEHESRIGGRVSQDEVVKAIREMNVGKAAGPLEVSAEMIVASGEIATGVMVELCLGGIKEECRMIGR